MKKILFTVLSFFVFAIGACSSSQYDYVHKEIQYLQTTIANVNDYDIYLSNGLTLRSNRLIIAVNSSPILLVIDNNLRSGYFYNRNSKVNVTFSNLFDIDLLMSNEGYLHFVQSVDIQNKIVTLVDGSNWYIPNEIDISKVNAWQTNPEIIIPINKSEQGNVFIHPVSSESIFAVRVEVIQEK